MGMDISGGVISMEINQVNGRYWLEHKDKLWILTKSELKQLKDEVNQVTPLNVGEHIQSRMTDEQELIENTCTSSKELKGMIDQQKTYELSKLKMVLDYLQLDIANSEVREWFEQSVEPLPTKRQKRHREPKKVKSSPVKRQMGKTFSNHRY